MEELSTVYRVRRTVLQMLQDRSYVISQEDLNTTLEQFRDQFGENPPRERFTILAQRRDDSAEQIFVFWAEEPKIGVKPIKNYVERMEQEKINRAILILKDGITSFAKRALLEMQNPADPSKGKRHIELFEQNELFVNITEHVLVPKHIVLAEDEKQALLKKYKLKETQLPRIQHVDPVARYFGVTKGQVIKIIRPSETAGRYVTYRLVV